MSVPGGASILSSIGTNIPLGAVGLVPIVQPRNPTTADVKGPFGSYILGQPWVNSSTAAVFLLGASTVSSSGVVQSTWTATGSTGVIVSLTGDVGSAVVPDGAGDLDTLGTANQIITTGTTNTMTWSLSPTLVTPGSLSVTTTLGVTGLSTLAALTQVGTASLNASGAGVTTIGTGGTGAVNIGNATGNTAVTGSLTASTSLTATAGDITATLGNVIINGAAKQLRVHGGAATDFIGQATLVNGTVTISNTNIAATDRVFVDRSAVNASSALGVFKTVVTGATSFVITACKPADATTETGDVSTVSYFIVRQV